MLKKWNVTTIIRQRYLWDNFVILPLTSTFTLKKPVFTSHACHFNSHFASKYVRHLFGAIYLPHSSQISHIELSTIIRTCPRKVKVTVLSNPACSTTSTFWIIELISDFLVININIIHSTKMREYNQNWNTRCSLCCWLYLLFMELYS